MICNVIISQDLTANESPHVPTLLQIETLRTDSFEDDLTELTPCVSLFISFYWAFYLELTL